MKNDRMILAAVNAAVNSIAQEAWKKKKEKKKRKNSVPQLDLNPWPSDTRAML